MATLKDLSVQTLLDMINGDYNPVYAKDYAQTLMSSYEREELPDWVEIMANGNLSSWSDVMVLVRNTIAAMAIPDVPWNDEADGPLLYTGHDGELHQFVEGEELK